MPKDRGGLTGLGRTLAFILKAHAGFELESDNPMNLYLKGLSGQCVGKCLRATRVRSRIS